MRAVSRSASLRFTPVTPSTAVLFTWAFVVAEAVLEYAVFDDPLNARTL